MTFRNAKFYLLIAAAFELTLQGSFAADHSETRRNGRYQANIKTEYGTYRVPVDVRDGEVATVRWPNGEKMKLRGADLNKGQATGQDFFGDRFKVSIDDHSYENDDSEEYSNSLND